MCLYSSDFACLPNILKKQSVNSIFFRYLIVAILSQSENVKDIVNAWPALGTGEPGGLDWGITPQVNVSIMASCLHSQYLPKSCAMGYAIDRAMERLRPIYRQAMALNAYVLMDMAGSVTVRSTDANDPANIVAEVVVANESTVDAAVAVAKAAFPAWSAIPASQRTEVLLHSIALDSACCILHIMYNIGR